MIMQNKKNYQKELERVLAEEDGKVPSLLLHSCCAPCSSYVLEYLSRYFAITVFYFNPNIYPEEEYHYRAAEQQRLIREMKTEHPVQFIEGRFEPSEYYAAVRGLEHVPEGGERCQVCFRLRLGEAAREAAKGGFDYFTTTLTISPLKNAEVLNQIGMEEAQKYGVKWLPSDFKKKNGYKRSTELSREYGLYRQDYCGCVFSKRERELRSGKKNGNVNFAFSKTVPQKEEAGGKVTGEKVGEAAVTVQIDGSFAK